ncbi:putative Acetyl-coenzyme A synthetase [Proteus penneri ATCC 35198]|nr:putative Acetyl-coenzyme A synthetase [Proteus penneri ATCC 35198]
MTKINQHHIPASIAEHALINKEQYQKDYELSIKNPEAFWADKGKIVDWIKPYTVVKKIHPLTQAMYAFAGLKMDN